MNIKSFNVALAAALVLGAGGAAAASQAVNLSQQQKQAIEQQLSTKKAQRVPVKFAASVGATAPQSLILQPLPQQLASKIKAVRNDDYAKLKNNEILITSPTNRKVVAVLHENGLTTGSNAGMMKPSSK